MTSRDSQAELMSLPISNLSLVYPSLIYPSIYICLPILNLSVCLSLSIHLYPTRASLPSVTSRLPLSLS